MDDARSNDIETRLSTLRVAILERPAPGLEDAHRRFRQTRRRPVQLAVFVAGVAVLVAALVVYGVNPAARSTTSQPNAESTLAQRIDKFAEQAAARAGDAKITEDLWVATDARAANALSGSIVESNAPVYLVQVPGSFSPVGPFGGPGAMCSPRPLYRVAVFVVLKSTFEIVDSALQQNFDDIGKLGPVHVDRLRSGPLFPPTTETTISPLIKGVVCASKPAHATFVALAQKGADGTFSATYDVPAQLKTVATVVRVAHLAPAGSTSPTSGSWMFEVDRTASGHAFLWVAHPHSTAFCTRYDTSRWSCEQTSLTFPQGNGWLLSAAFYLPLTELAGIEQSDPDSTTSRQVVDKMPVVCMSD